MREQNRAGGSKVLPLLHSDLLAFNIRCLATGVYHQYEATVNYMVKI